MSVRRPSRPARVAPHPATSGPSAPKYDTAGLFSERGILRNYSTVEGTIEAIRDESRLQGLRLFWEQAYVLATTKHETGDSWEPVRECFYLGKRAEGVRRHLKYYPWYGRGFTQLTWEYNYVAMNEILKASGRFPGVDIVRNPDLAMDPEVANFIMVYGFIHGTFTTKKLSQYINAGKVDLLGARRCINGTDRAKLIAGYATSIHKNLVKAHG